MCVSLEGVWVVSMLSGERLGQSQQKQSRALQKYIRSSGEDQTICI